MTAMMTMLYANSISYVTISTTPFSQGGSSVRRCGAPQGHNAELIISAILRKLTSFELNHFFCL